MKQRFSAIPVILLALLALLGLAACSSDACKHDMIEVPALAATCTENGHTAYFACTKCDGIFADKDGKKPLTDAEAAVAAAGHKLSAIIGTPATCTEEGIRDHYRCEACGKIYADAQANNPLPSPMEPAHHTAEKVAGVLPTTDRVGVREHYKCASCGLLFADSTCAMPLAEEETVIPVVSELLDGVATPGFYPDTHTAEIGRDVTDGGVGLQVLARRTENGIYVWYRVNHNVPVDEQDNYGVLHFIIMTHGTDNQTLPGPISYCGSLGLVMDISLDGTIGSRNLLDSIFTATQKGSKTAFSTVGELFISNEMLASIDDTAAACFERTEAGKLNAVKGANVFVNVVADMAGDPADAFESTDLWKCDEKDDGVWYQWYRSGFCNHNISSQNMFVVTDKGLSLTIPPVTDVYTVEPESDSIAELGELPETVGSGDVLKGRITLRRSGYNLLGVSINDIVVPCEADGSFAADLRTIGLSAHAESLVIKAVTVKSDAFATTSDDDVVIIDGKQSAIVINAPLGDYSRWYSASLALPATAVDNYTLTFNVRDVTNSQAGWPTAEWAAQRFAVQLTSSKNGFFFFTCKGEANIRRLTDTENPGVEGAYITEISRGNAYAWVDELIRSENGANLRIEKLGSVYTMSIEQDGSRVVLGSVKGEDNDNMQIVFMACGSSRYFSGISLELH